VGLVMTVSGVMASDGCLCAAGHEGTKVAPAPVVAPPTQQAVAPQNPGVALSAARDVNGTPVLRFSGNGVQVRKVVQSDGRFTMWIRAEDDEVGLTGDPGVLTISRQGRTVTVYLSRLEDGAMDLARTLVADSKAMRRFRAAAYALSPAEAATPAGAGLQLTATFLSLLDGDLGAVKRLPGRSKPRPAGSPSGSISPMSAEEEEVNGPACYEHYVQEVVSAWYDYQVCSVSVGMIHPLVELCAFEWLLRVESAWFQFLGCSSVPIR
jgi:hypothetical protein